MRKLWVEIKVIVQNAENVWYQDDKGGIAKDASVKIPLLFGEDETPRVDGVVGELMKALKFDLEEAEKAEPIEGEE